MTVQQNISDLLNKESLDFLKGLHFFRLCSCTTEKVDNMSLYLQEQFSKLFTAIYPLNRPVVFGIVSRKCRSSLVIGFQAASEKGIVSQLMNGLFSGIELEDFMILVRAF